MGKKLYVGNLTYSVTHPICKEWFTPFGTVQSAQVITDRDMGRSKGFGFVEMDTDAQAEAAIQGLNDHEHDGRRLMVSEAKPREPRSGGGGAAAAVAAVATAAVAVVATVIDLVHTLSVGFEARDGGASNSLRTRAWELTGDAPISTSAMSSRNSKTRASLGIVFRIQPADCGTWIRFPHQYTRDAWVFFGSHSSFGLTPSKRITAVSLDPPTERPNVFSSRHTPILIPAGNGALNHLVVSRPRFILNRRSSWPRI